MFCGPEKAWPTGTGFGNRSGSRKTEFKCGPVTPELIRSRPKIKDQTIIVNEAESVCFGQQKSSIFFTR